MVKASATGHVRENATKLVTGHMPSVVETASPRANNAYLRRYSGLSFDNFDQPEGAAGWQWSDALLLYGR